MTPHRDIAFIAAVLQHVQRLPATPIDSVAVAAAGVVAAIGWAFGSANVALLWVVACAMLLDLIVGSLAALIRGEFCAVKLYSGFLGKLFRVLFVPTASLVDWLFIASPLPLPDAYADAFPATAFVLMGVAAAEVTSLIGKYRDVYPRLVEWVAKRIERAEEVRHDR